MTKGNFICQIHCDECGRYMCDVTIDLPLDKSFRVGCDGCKNNRKIYISSSFGVYSYAQFSINKKQTIAFGFTRVS